MIKMRRTLFVAALLAAFSNFGCSGAMDAQSISEIMSSSGTSAGNPTGNPISPVEPVADDDTISTRFEWAPFEGDAKITLTGSRIVLHFNPILNMIFNRSVEISPGFTVPSQFQVIAITDDNFTIKRYGLLTDKKLTLEAEILESTPNVKKVKKKESVIKEIVTTDSA